MPALTERERRLWARNVFPMLEGMSPRRVRALRLEWIKATTYLGRRWVLNLRRARKQRKEPILRVVGE